MTDPDIDLNTAKLVRIDHVGAAAAAKPGEVPVATATAVPLDGFPTFSTSNLMTDPSIQALKEQGFPMGLAQELGNTKTAYPFRFWIVDNSGYVYERCIGNMVAHGGKVLILIAACS
jgi:hypothetical protein